MLFGTSSHLLVLHDAEEAGTALRAALATAPADQIPGLRRAVEIPAEVSGSEAVPQQRWAERVLVKMVCGVRCAVCGARCAVRGVRCAVRGARCGARCGAGMSPRD